MKKLENKGYISRVRSSIDERNLELTVTKKGLDLRDKAMSIPEKIGECINLSEEEVSVLYKLSYKILKNILEEEK